MPAIPALGNPLVLLRDRVSYFQHGAATTKLQPEPQRKADSADKTAKRGVLGLSKAGKQRKLDNHAR